MHFLSHNAFALIYLFVTIQAALNIPGVLPGAYIVRFVSGQNSQDAFYQNLTANGISHTQRQSFVLRPEIFSGASFHIASEEKGCIDTIRSFEQVHSITPVRLVSRVAPTRSSLYSRKSSKKRLGELSSKTRLAGLYNDTITTHTMTGVDKLHQEGYDGRDIKIAEIDTGIDYTLAALGGCFGSGCKVGFGYDLVGDDYDGTNIPLPDADPMDCQGHGTHVAGIIGASNDPYVLGVAPNTTLGIFKVFGCQGQVTNDVLISAFIVAYNYSPDVITASVGAANGWPEDPWTAVVAYIVAAGTPCILAGGNDGAEGLYYASAASAGQDVTSVGSVDNINTPTTLLEAYSIVQNSSMTPFGYVIETGSLDGLSLPLYADTYDTSVPDDGCNGFDADLSGKIVLIRRGTCSFIQKAQSALDAGAGYVIFYNNQPGTIETLLDGSHITAVAMVDPDTGARLIGELATGSQVFLEFPENVTLLIDSPGPVNTLSGGSMSTFSTSNPTNENAIKPVVSAPGGNILSTYLADEGGYAVLSGTSMATPFIAGVVALYKQAHGAAVHPTAINAALSSTAKPLQFNNGSITSQFLTTVAQQGGGLVDAYHMVHATISITTANLAFNDTANHLREARFDMQNTGKVLQTYSLTHQPAANVYVFDPANTSYAASFPPPMDTSYATAVISPSALSIEPEQTQCVAVSITPDPSLDPSLVPIYSGFIQISSSNNETIRVPYLGIATVIHNIPIFAPDTAVLNTSFAIFREGNISTFAPSIASVPLLLWNNRWASAEMRLDVVSMDGPNPVVSAGLDTIGAVDGFPLMWQPRGIEGELLGAEWDGTLVDGSSVESGAYKFVLRLAKAFGDLESGSDYETFESEKFVMDMN